MNPIRYKFIPLKFRYFIWISIDRNSITLQIHHYHMEKFYREYSLKF